MKYEQNHTEQLRCYTKEKKFGILVGLCSFIRSKYLNIVKALKIVKKTHETFKNLS